MSLVTAVSRKPGDTVVDRKYRAPGWDATHHPEHRCAVRGADALDHLVRECCGAVDGRGGGRIYVFVRVFVHVKMRCKVFSAQCYSLR